MNEYIIHIFNVDNRGCIIGATEKIHTIYARNDIKACIKGEALCNFYDMVEPLPYDEEWGRKLKWLMHIIKDDKVIV